MGVAVAVGVGVDVAVGVCPGDAGVVEATGVLPVPFVGVLTTAVGVDELVVGELPPPPQAATNTITHNSNRLNQII